MKLLNLVSAHAVYSFIIFVAILAVLWGVAILVSSYPCKFFVKNIHKEPMLDLEAFYFYYQKATAYRMLFMVHTGFCYMIKIMGAVMTFVTVYCALDKNNYILFCSLVAALCEVMGLIVPTDKYMKIYVQSARLLEFELNSKHNNDDEAKEKLKAKYKEAEKIIEQDFL